MEIKWNEPPVYAKRPGQGGTPGRYVKFAFELQKHPERWAVLPSQSTSTKGAEATAHNIRRGRVKGFEKGRYEVAVDDLTIYVRYMGDPEDDAEPEPVEDEENPPSRGEIRAWAKSKGIAINDRGRLPVDVIDAFMKERAREA